MVSVTWIVLFSILVVSILGVISTAIIFTKPVDEQKVSFMRIFPFEVIRTAEKEGKYYSLSTYLFAGMCFSPLISIIGEETKLRDLNPLTILIVCVLGLAALCFIFLNIFDVTHTKPHLTLFTVFAFLVLLSGALLFTRALVGYNTCLDHGEKEYLFLVSEILTGLSFIFVLCIVLNPKLKTWPKLDLIDGEYVRPKRFPLAYSEWGILLALFFNEIVLFIELLVK